MTGIASKAQLRMSFLRYALVTVPLVLLIGIMSGQLAGSGYGNPWFDALQKPSFMPPGWVFGAVWTTLYILLGFVLAMLLHAHGARYRGIAIGLFLVQLLVNFAWSPTFSAMHEIRWALILIVVMILLTLFLIRFAWGIRRVAALLLFPYLAWLCFAGALTYAIDGLNGGNLAREPGSTDIIL